MKGSSGPLSYCGWALGLTLPFRTTVWLLSMLPRIRSGCSAHAPTQRVTLSMHNVQKAVTERLATALRFGVEDTIISSYTRLGCTGMHQLPGEGLKRMRRLSWRARSAST